MLEVFREGNSPEFLLRLHVFVLQHALGLPATTGSCQASAPGIPLFPVKKLGRLIPKGESGCLSAGIFPRVTEHLVITDWKEL